MVEKVYATYNDVGVNRVISEFRLVIDRHD